MVFPLAGQTLLLIRPEPEPGRRLQIAFVLPETGPVISGKNTKIRIEQKNPGKPSQKTAPEKHIQYDTDQHRPQKEAGKSILTVPSLHKTIKSLSHGNWNSFSNIDESIVVSVYQPIVNGKYEYPMNFL